MLIYIEGLDKAGKSTFAKQLSASLRIPIYQKRPPQLLDPREHHSYFKGVGFALTELHNLLNFNAIIDRSFISDWVYANRSEDICPIRIWSEWEHRHNSANRVIIVYVDTPTAVVEARVLADPDPYMLASDIIRFQHLYELYLRQTRFRIVHIDGAAPANKRADDIALVNRMISVDFAH